MVQKTDSFIKIFILATTYCYLLITIGSCQMETTKTATIIFDYAIDTTGIPKDTVDLNDENVALINGIYHIGNEKISGILSQTYPSGIIKSYSSLLNGQLHGTYKSFYKNGKPHEVRQYKNNLATGQHYAYWNDDKKHFKFFYNYYKDKREGLQKKWYPNGTPFIFANFKNDNEDGLQQAWRQNGKLYLNYEAKDGKKYGLQKSNLCYDLADEKIKTSVTKD